MRTVHIAVGVTLLLVGLTVCALPAKGQESGERIGYDSLPPRDENNRKSHWLLGPAKELDAYVTLTREQRSTYEAIMHALHSQGLLRIVDAVTAIWGVPVREDGRVSSVGNEQFRLSVILSREAVEVLGGRGFRVGRWWSGHVMLASGAKARRPRDMRESGIPSLQVSWSTTDPRFGEIDIDYRGHGFAHGYPANSDIRAEHRGTSHYCLHMGKYESELVDWWNAEAEDCAARSETTLEGLAQLEGWAQLGLTRVQADWAFDVPSLELGSRIRANREVGVHSILNRDAPTLGSIARGQCALLVELDERRYGGEFWIRVRRVDCEDPQD